MSKKAVDKSAANGFSRDEHIEVANTPFCTRQNPPKSAKIHTRKTIS